MAADLEPAAIATVGFAHVVDAIELILCGALAMPAGEWQRRRQRFIKKRSSCGHLCATEDMAEQAIAELAVADGIFIDGPRHHPLTTARAASRALMYPTAYDNPW